MLHHDESPATIVTEDVSHRVVRLETKMDDVYDELAELNQKMDGMATKADMENLRHFFNGRSKEASDRLWWVTRAAVGTVLLLVALFMKLLFGMESAADLIGLFR